MSDPSLSDIDLKNKMTGLHLRVVQIQAMLFLKAMSERVGSDILYTTTLKLSDEFLNRLKFD